MPLSAQRQKLKKNRNHLQRRKKSGQPESINAQPVVETAEPQLDFQNFTPDNVMNLQRTIGNKATRNLVTSSVPSHSVQRGFMSKLKKLFGGGDKKEKEMEISGPMNGRVMDKSEYGDAKSMKELMDQKAKEDEQAEIDSLMQLPDDILGKIKELPVDIGNAVADFFTAAEILMNDPQLVANPEFKKEHRSLFILPRKKFAIHKDGAWTGETYSYDDDNSHTFEIQGVVGEYYMGKLGDGTTIAKVKKADTTAAVYEKLDATTPLFEEGQPKASDVKQGGLGDCYLMAALSSLAQQDPNYIKEIMVDQGDKVAVRLYEVDETDPSDHKFNAKYFSVEKSIAKLNGKALYNTGALWVSIMEKAYAAGGFSGTGVAPTTPTTEMDSIDSGFSYHAFEVLTGKTSKRINMDSGPELQTGGNYGHQNQTGWKGTSYNYSTNSASVPWDASTVKAYDDLKAGPQPDDYSPLPIFNGVFKGNKGHVDKWIAYVKTGAVGALFTKQNTEHSAGYAHQVAIQDFQALFNKEGSGLDATVGTAVLEWIKTNQMFPGELGTGIYSKTQLKAYDEIKTALAGGKSIALSSFKFPSKTSDGTGHSGGEAISKGMVGGHAYSALGVKGNTTNDPTTDPGTGNFHWIQVRNPWGKYGREYDFSQVLPADAAKAVENGDGIFWLELSDLTKYFHSYDVTG